MLNKYKVYFHNTVLYGEVIQAEYYDQLMEKYKGNPYIEALRPILSREEAEYILSNFPSYSPEEKNLPEHYRIHCVDTITELRVPFNIIIDTEQCISRMIRQGYVGRNPLTIEVTKQLNVGYEAIAKKDIGFLKNHCYLISTASSQIILGPSGIGKSKAIELILLSFPQVIIHKKYKEKQFYTHQIVWLKVDCPFDGGIKALCLKILKTIDGLVGTTYFEKHDDKSVAVLIPIICEIATNLGLGMLVIDEIQNLNEAKGEDSDKMLNFFVDLINTAGFPLILIGTLEAESIFNSKFQDARRGTGEIPPIWGRMTNGKEWNKLINKIWEYQWVKNECILTTKISDALYNESQGIIDLAIKLYRLAQMRAISTGYEKIDENIIHSVAKDCLSLVRPMLNALKSGTKKAVKPYKDLYLPNSIIDNYKAKSLNALDTYEEAKNLEKTIRDKKDISKLAAVSEISSWLIQAGFKAEDCIKYAQEVTSESSDYTDIAGLRKKAFLLAGQSIPNNDAITTYVAQKTTKKVPKNNENLNCVPVVSQNSSEKFPDIFQKKYILKNT